MKADCLRSLALVSLLALTCVAQGGPSGELSQRVESLVARMTLEEKIGQLGQYSGFKEEFKTLIREGKIGSLLNVTGAANTNQVQRLSVEESRLGIPLLFGFDVIHGYRTVFPIPLAEASTWDPALVEQAARVAATEAAAAGVRWTFSPMVDIARDPRWGRIAEGAGEDPYLGSAMAAARVRGFQGRDLSDPSSVVACAKHYVAYGGAEGGRDYNTVDLSEQTLREIYLPPFKAAVDAGAGTLMSAFNDLNGVPASANSFTLTEILRHEWGFDGFVVSDWNAIGEFLHHGFAATGAEAARMALVAGVDMDMEGNIYAQHLAQLVREGKVSEEAVNQAVRRILRIKFKLGLFERPYVSAERERAVLLSPESLAVARQVAQRSIVLLKNEKNLLPLNPSLRTLAVIGPLADNQKELLGSWFGAGRAEDVVSVLEGIRRKVAPTSKIRYAKGSDILDGSDEALAEAVRIAKESDVAILALGEAGEMSGEAASRAFLDLPGRQEELLQTIHATGVPVVLVLMNGRSLSIAWAAEHVPAILETWFLGVQAGNAIADVLFGDVNPGGKLPVSFPRTVGQVPIYYNHKNTGRPATAEKYTSKYLDVSVTPLYPFGYGLSYTRFKFAHLRLSANRMRRAGELRVSVEVENVGERGGDEVVQLYVRDLVGSRTRPVKELKGFQRITLRPGEKQRVEFTLAARALGFYNLANEYVIEPGAFKLWVGPNSVEGLEASFEITPE